MQSTFSSTVAGDPRGHHHGRQWALGGGRGTPAVGRAPRGRGGGAPRRRGRAGSRHRHADSLRLLLGQLAAAAGRGPDPDAAVRGVPARRGRPLRRARRPRLGHRTARPPSRRRGGGHLGGGGADRRGRRLSLRVAVDYSSRDAIVAAARRLDRSSTRPRASGFGHRLADAQGGCGAGRGSADPHGRRAAAQRFPPLGVRLRGAPLHDADVARLRRGGLAAAVGQFRRRERRFGALSSATTAR